MPFIAPVVIDDTTEAGARVPAGFLRVPWTLLPGARPSPQFVEQIKRLLAPPSKLSAAGVARVSRPVDSGEPGSKNHPAKPRIPAAAWIAATTATVIASGVTATFFTRRTSAPGSTPPASTPPLVAEARALSEPWDLGTPDDFAFAEDWLKRAVALDPTDGAAGAAYPVVAGGTRVMLDPSETWSPAARSRAEKAIKLAPQEPRARFT